MLATIVIDSYSENEALEIADALSELVNSNMPSEWSSAGIYCYWNYYTKEILYFGLAIDLYERFKQHNGLIKIKKGGCKHNEIKDYFKSNERIGFSIMLQSSLSQPITAKMKKKYSDIWELNKEEIEEIGIDGKNSIQLLEGVLIQAYKLVYSQFPLWNKIGGSVIGKIRAQRDDIELMLLFTNSSKTASDNISRSTIRELVKIPTYNRYESYLYAIRITPMNIKATIELHVSMGINTMSEIISSGYLFKKLLL